VLLPDIGLPHDVIDNDQAAGDVGAVYPILFPMIREGLSEERGAEAHQYRRNLPVVIQCAIGWAESDFGPRMSGSRTRHLSIDD
jgi:hypothetical protein